MVGLSLSIRLYQYTYCESHLKIKTMLRATFLWTITYVLTFDGKASKVTSSEITHLRAGTEFWEGETSWNIFQ